MNRQLRRLNEKEFNRTKKHRVKKSIRKVLKQLEKQSENNG